MTGGPLAGRRFAVQAELLLGRVDADVTIDDPQISRRHAIVRPAANGLEIEDLGSLNGTWVNGKRITSARSLTPGDVIGLGGTTVAVEADRPGEARTVLAPAPAQSDLFSIAPPGPDVQGTPPADELRTVTALFADVVGSTGFGERLAPDEVKVLLGESVTRMSREVERFGGSVQAYMGDGIAAFFGVPAVREDDPERAARAGLAIVRSIREYAQEVLSRWSIEDFSVRVGINTGQVAVGVVGAAEPRAVSVGDATNVAARLQSVAEPGTIAVGDATARALLDRYVLEPLGELGVKGRERAVSAWRLVCANDAVPVRQPTPLVDRAEELGRLRDVLDELDAGRGRVVLLVGEAGIGKTRLLSELDALASQRATWLEGQCLSFGTERVYDPFIRMLRTWTGAAEGEPDSSARAKLRARLDLLDVDAAADTPYLARLLGLRPDPGEDDHLEHLPHDELGAELRRAYLRWVESIARRGAVAVALDDLHWADASTCALIEGLLELTDRVPLLLVGTIRPDPECRGWALRVKVHAEFPHRAVELPLGPLSAEHASTLLEQLPRSAEVDASSRALIVATAEGNPLYLEELLTGFADGAAEKRGTTWAPTVTHRGLLTPTLENLMVSQIDRLEPSARQLTQVAAVIGRRFPRRVLEHVAADRDLTEELTELLRAGVVREARRYPETEYVFRHGLLRQAALSTITPPARRTLYGEVARAIETLYAASLDDHLEVLAQYFRRSNDLPKALEYLERAAERAIALDALGDARELLQAALDLSRELGGDQAEAERLQARIDDPPGAKPRRAG